MARYHIDINPSDNSVASIRLEQDPELFARDQVIELDDEVDLIRYLLESMDKDSDLIFNNGKLVMTKELSDSKQLRNVRRKIVEMQAALYLQHILVEVVETGQPFERINQLRIQREEQHGALQNERARLEEVIEEGNHKISYEAAKARLANSNYQFTNVICAIAKDETPYLIEWLTYHLDLGIEHIFLHDDGSHEPIRQTIKSLSPADRKKVTITEDKVLHSYTTQRAVYARWLREWEGKVKWVCFLDIDEFLDLGNQTVGAFLDKFSEDEDIGEINIGWVEYNAGGAMEKAPDRVRDKFTTVSPMTPYAKKFWMGKYFVRPEVVEKIRIHECVIASGFKRVSPDGFAVKPCCTASMELGQYPDPLNCSAHVKHYFTKSYAEWIDKIKRGACDNYLRRKEEFFWHNPDMAVIDDSVQVYGH